MISSGLTLMADGENSTIKTSQTNANGSSDKENNTQSQNKSIPIEDTMYKSFTKEEVKHEEPKMTSDLNKNKVLEDLDNDLIVPGKVEQVDIPHFTESVKITDPKAIKNPFKSNKGNTCNFEEKRLEGISEEENGNIKADENVLNEDKDNYEKIIALEKTSDTLKKRNIREARPIDGLQYNDIIEKAQVNILDYLCFYSYNRR